MPQALNREEGLHHPYPSSGSEIGGWKPRYQGEGISGEKLPGAGKEKVTTIAKEIQIEEIICSPRGRGPCCEGKVVGSFQPLEVIRRHSGPSRKGSCMKKGVAFATRGRPLHRGVPSGRKSSARHKKENAKKHPFLLFWRVGKACQKEPHERKYLIK